MPDAVRLNRSFDAAALATDAARLRPADWVAHFNTRIYEGDWSGASLRSVAGRPDRIYPDPAPTEPIADTELLERCPATQAALATFDCELLAVRLLRLGPGARVREHRDYRLGFDDGDVRLHIPVTTSPLTEFVLDGQLVPMAAGECWYVNVNKPHRVVNRDHFIRVHLVLDCRVNEWLANELRQGLPNRAPGA